MKKLVGMVVLCVATTGFGCGGDKKDNPGADGGGGAGGTPAPADARADTSGAGGTGGATDAAAGTMPDTVADRTAAGGNDANDANDANDGSVGCNIMVSVLVDGARRQACTGTLSTGGLNHIISTLDDGSTVVLNFTGQVPGDDVCAGISLRKPGSTTNDWNAAAAACIVQVTEYGPAGGGRIKGTFSAALTPAAGNTGGPRMLNDGTFDARRP